MNWSYYDNGFFPEYTGTQYVVNSVTPDFLVSEQRVVDNGTSSQIMATFTSSESKTFSLTLTVGLSDVTYTINTYDNIGQSPPDPACYLTSSEQGTSVAPTINPGWRVLPG